MKYACEMVQFLFLDVGLVIRGKTCAYPSPLDMVNPMCGLVGAEYGLNGGRITILSQIHLHLQ